MRAQDNTEGVARARSASVDAPPLDTETTVHTLFDIYERDERSPTRTRRETRGDADRTESAL
jgi:hypothetical protein